MTSSNNENCFLDLILEHQHHGTPPASPTNINDKTNIYVPITLLTLISDSERLTDALHILQPLFRPDRPVRIIQSSSMHSFVGHHYMKLQSVEQIELGPYAQHTFQILSDLDMEKFSKLLMLSIRTAISRERGWRYLSECYPHFSLSGSAGVEQHGTLVTPVFCHKMSFTYTHLPMVSERGFPISPLRQSFSETQDAASKPSAPYAAIQPSTSYEYDYDQSYNTSNAVTPGRM